LADIASKDDEKAEKMAYQMQRLANNNGQPEKIHGIINNWLTLGPTQAEQVRFNTALSSIVDKNLI
jgi:hypothetical protein